MLQRHRWFPWKDTAAKREQIFLSFPAQEFANSERWIIYGTSGERKLTLKLACFSVIIPAARQLGWIKNTQTSKTRESFLSSTLCAYTFGVIPKAYKCSDCFSQNFVRFLLLIIPARQAVKTQLVGRYFVISKGWIEAHGTMGLVCGMLNFWYCKPFKVWFFVYRSKISNYVTYSYHHF